VSDTTPNGGPEAAPRLAPLAPDDLDPYMRSIYGAVGRGGAANMVATMGHHPHLSERFLPVTIALQAGELPGRQREMVILRVAVWRRCRYVWEQHARLALRAGLGVDALGALATGATSAVWEDADRIVLAAVDQLLADSTMDDATWEALATVYGPSQLVELCILVGHYSGLCFLANAADVALDEGGDPVPALPDPVGGLPSASAPEGNQ